MLRLFLLCSILASPAMVGSDLRDVTYQGDLSPRNILPTFDRGYLLAYEGAGRMSVYGPSGDLLFHAVATVPAAKTVLVQNAAADVDGTVVAAVEYVTDHQHRGGLALFGPAGEQKHFFYTGEYLPVDVDFGPDHSVWTAGWTGPDRESDPSDYSVVRNYSREGMLLGEFLPRSTFDPKPDPLGPIVGGWRLRVTNRSVGAAFYVASPRDKIQWVELDLKGKILGRWNLPPKDISAYTDDGTVYARDPTGLSVLDHTSGAWRSVPAMSGGTLLGADGDYLVYMVSGYTLRHTGASP